jgi:hypothetical protein
MADHHDQAAIHADVQPSKKTAECKEFISPANPAVVITALRQQLAEAHECIDGLRSELGLAVNDVPQLGLRNSHARMFGILMAKPSVRHSSMMNILYGDRAAEGDIPELTSIKTLICTLRQKLKPFGIEIETIWGEGWRITESNKAAARRIIGGESA